MADSQSLKVVFVSHTVDGGYFKVGSHHLARELAIRGHRVAHVSTSASIAHLVRGPQNARRLSLALRGPEIDSFGVVHAVPRSLVPLRASLSHNELPSYISRIGFGDADFVIVDQPLMAAACNRFDRSKVVYRATDVYEDGRARRGEDLLLARLPAAIVGTSVLVLNRLVQRSPETPSLLLTNGVDTTAFIPNETSIVREGAVYVGAIDKRFDWQAVLDIAGCLYPKRVTIAGPVTVGLPSRIPTNVKLIGPVAYADVPHLLQSHTVGLLPFFPAAENHGRSPMKYYEYLASGLYVLSSDLHEVRSRADDGVFFYGPGFERLTSTIASILRLPAGNQGGARLAGLNRWSTKAAKLIQFLGQLREQPS